MKLGVNFAIFVLFFGLALLEAIQSQNWPKALLFAALGVVSFFADHKFKKK